MVFIVDVRDSHSRGIWNCPEQTGKSSRLNRKAAVNGEGKARKGTKRACGQNGSHVGIRSWRKGRDPHVHPHPIEKRRDEQS